GVESKERERGRAKGRRKGRWVTAQDGPAIDMVSLITVSRRYNFKLAGQLTLAQRNHAETARRAYVVDSRVPGPNVFLDSDSISEFVLSPIKPERIGVNPLYPRHPRSINPHTDLKTALAPDLKILVK